MAHERDPSWLPKPPPNAAPTIAAVMPTAITIGQKFRLCLIVSIRFPGVVQEHSGITFNSCDPSCDSRANHSDLGSIILGRLLGVVDDACDVLLAGVRGLWNVDLTDISCGKHFICLCEIGGQEVLRVKYAKGEI